MNEEMKMEASDLVQSGIDLNLGMAGFNIEVRERLTWVYSDARRLLVSLSKRGWTRSSVPPGTASSVKALPTKQPARRSR